MFNLQKKIPNNQNRPKKMKKLSIRWLNWISNEKEAGVDEKVTSWSCKQMPKRGWEQVRRKDGRYEQELILCVRL